MATILTPNDQNDPNNPSQGTSAPSMGTTAPATSSMAQPQRQGSGRFTNIQKYINANKTSGQNLVNNVTGTIQKDINGQQQKADDSASAVRAGIEQGQQGLNQGSQFGQQLNTIGQNIKAQTSTDQNQNYANRDANALGIDQFDNNNYQKFQQGQGFDENRLGLQNRTLVNQNQNLQNVANQNLQNISSDSGRFNMIRNMFGKNVNPGYTSGQQRLDTTFLSQNPLTDLRKNLTGAQQYAQQGLNESQRLGQNISNMTQTEKDLIGQNQNVANSNSDAYLNMLGSYTGEINKQRAGEFQTLQDQLNSLQQNSTPGFQKATPGQTPNATMDAATLARLGVNGPRQAYNVFNNLKNTDIATQGRDAAGYQDVANQGDVDKFAMLSKIANQDPSRLTQASQLGNAWDSKTGSDSLDARLNQANENFNKYAQAKDYMQHQAGSNWAESRGNLQDILQGKNIVQGDKRNTQALGGQADAIYANALKDLQSQGYGNILGGNGTMQNILPTSVQSSYETPNANKNNAGIRLPGQQGTGAYDPSQYTNAAAQQLLRTQRNINFRNSNLDEQLASALDAAGIKKKENSAF